MGKGEEFEKEGPAGDIRVAAVRKHPDTNN